MFDVFMVVLFSFSLKNKFISLLLCTFLMFLFSSFFVGPDQQLDETQMSNSMQYAAGEDALQQTNFVCSNECENGRFYK